MLLDLNVQTTSRLGLEPIKNPAGGYLYNGCVPAIVIGISVAEQEHTKGEFANLKVPVLQVEFENFKLNVTDPDRFYTHNFKVIGTKQLVAGTSDQYENRPEVDIVNDTNDLWKGIKHFLENLYTSPNYRDITKIPKEDFTTYFNIPGLGAPEDKIKGYNAFFGYIAKFVLGDGKEFKSQILTAESKPLPMWLKMLPNYDKDPKRHAKYYVIPRFINQGVFEAMITDKGLPVGNPKIIRVKPTEDLTLKANVTGAPIPGVTGGAQGAVTIPGMSPEVAKLLGGGQ